MSETTSEAWAAVADDPDSNRDLGYDLQALTVVRVNEDGNKYIVLPGEKEHLTDEEFIVASAGSVCLLSECR